MKLEFNNHKKMTEPFFEKNCDYTQNVVNWAFWGLESTFVNFCPNFSSYFSEIVPNERH